MANILLFEDYLDSVSVVQDVLKESEHDLVGFAEDLGHVQAFMSKILANEIMVDVLILDGNLYPTRSYKSLVHTFPPDPNAAPVKRLLRKPRPAQPREIVVEPEGAPFGTDARMVQNFMQLCDIEIPIIGFSSNSMKENGLSVDYDLGKIYDAERDGPYLLEAIDIVLRR